MWNNVTYLHKYMMGRLRRIYFMALPESKQDLKKSRIYFTTADTASQTIVQLAGGTFLATLMSHSGISDANIGIITSLISLAALSQLFLINILKRIKKYKLFVCVTSLQRLLFAFLYLIPLLGVRDEIKSVFIILLYLIGQISVQIGTPASQDWIASLVPSRFRGKYFAIKDSIAVFVLSSVLLLCGMILDYFKKQNIMTGFIIISIIIFTLTLINVIAQSMMKEPKFSYLNNDGKEMHGRLAKKAKDMAPELETQSILEELKEAFRNQNFRKAFTTQCLFIFGFYICIPFYASYQVNDLRLPYTYIMLVGFIFNLYRIYLSPRLGRMADKYGMGKVLRYSMLALGFNFLAMAFSMPFNKYPLQIIISLLSSTAWAFTGIGLFGLQLDFYKSEKRMIWLTLTSSITGALGFFVSILGGIILSYLQKLPLALFGQKIYAQQILSFFGFLIILFTVYFIRFHIETVKIDQNRQDGRIVS